MCAGCGQVRELGWEGHDGKIENNLDSLRIWLQPCGDWEGEELNGVSRVSQVIKGKESALVLKQ